jgi:hypothetical protein
MFAEAGLTATLVTVGISLPVSVSVMIVSHNAVNPKNDLVFLI